MQKLNKRLEGQTCIVTGSSDGIGEAIAKAMAIDRCKYCNKLS